MEYYEQYGLRSYSLPKNRGHINNIHCKMLDELAHPSLNCNGTTIKLWALVISSHTQVGM